ncbi:helix-turn-helix domain-containing protein [Sphingopyxis indica]|jgi:transcriptional regulator with XRE-family HTH domain|uniref:helix-turn-helix domain-containing protein n=1 Tax=Sphingopyxis indica TaxID=436663 RepID=UPI002938FC0A|nr:helix-turn-helix domain-containing protein [Sphingopyxis indica]WOF43881.1 helix-turn-helix domain-containing protein [Sphingopyxis indica]
MAERFDNEAFYAALNATRLSRQLTWKDVAEQAGISASTLTRIGQGKRPDIDGLAALLQWSGLKAETFIRDGEIAEAEPLARVTALLRADPNLSPENAKVLEDIVAATYSRLRGT